MKMTGPDGDSSRQRAGPSPPAGRLLCYKALGFQAPRVRESTPPRGSSRQPRCPPGSCWGSWSFACVPEASRAVETPLPGPQTPKKRRILRHCLWAPQSPVTPGQGYLPCLMSLHLQAPTAPGEICLMLVPGPRSPLALIPLTLLCLMTPGQQERSPQKTPGHPPLRWATDLRRNQTLTHPRKSTDREEPGNSTERTQAPSLLRGPLETQVFPLS
ncbi:psoriasis susceptibility 1 candidate gene 2 protein isoform X1 [Meriones unguiculatus]|uniref:psoriasis susceptibility 1 candidate gene 2 protein isoform X1 n=1 Tax=Meriones unguiculatus TaxID=10047 RepID=UPI000B4F7427|nr:psoriasis susceptibility 1 candidate gene 2 protein isoform X1 [Meriones unguiculatus]